MNTATILTTTGATLTQVRPTTSCVLLTRFYSTCPGLDFQLFRVRAINQGEEGWMPIHCFSTTKITRPEDQAVVNRRDNGHVRYLY